MKCKLVAAAVLATASPALARDDYGDVAGWQVLRVNDQTCAMTMEYEGPGSTELVFGKALDGDVSVMVANANWSALQKGNEPKMTVTIGGSKYVYDVTPTALKLSYKNGFGFLIADPDFWSDIAAGSDINFYTKPTDEQSKPKVIDELKLLGSRAAASRVLACLTDLRAEKRASEAYRKKWEHIPDDPFSN